MKKILILGGDGYLGWPTAMHFSALGYEVTVADNYLRRYIAEQTDSLPLISSPNMSERVKLFKKLTGNDIKLFIGDLADPEFMFSLFRDVSPDTIIHYAEQPSGPYSMRSFSEAKKTLDNNLGVTFNCIWALKEICPNAHLIKLGTMGEYGTPNIDIEEGWLDIEHNGRKDTVLYPRAAGSLYHTTKVLDTDLLWFYVRTSNLRVTDLMQGPVYGLSTPQTALSEGLLPHFHYDDIFGTVVNRFLVQAVAGIPMTVYGGGGQTRGYLNLIDTLKCVELATLNPAELGQLKIMNQFTETFSVNQLAEKICSAAKSIGMPATIQKIENPRKEKEAHYYNPKHTALMDLGLTPTLMDKTSLCEMLLLIKKHKTNIVDSRILPRVSWNN
jgi:UDP-sulfoquinovose synthase